MTVPKDEQTSSRAKIAEIVHDAMVWAAQQTGQPKPWQNGNSYAEDRAREAVRAIEATRPTAATDWFDKAIRDHCDEHGPSGGAWNISMILERLHSARPAAATGQEPDEVKLEPCETCGAKSPDEFSVCSDGFHAKGPLYWPCEHCAGTGNAHTRAAIEATRPTAATDVVKELVEALDGIRWKSADRDNMEFAATITYSQMDRIRAALTKARTGPSYG